MMEFYGGVLRIACLFLSGVVVCIHGLAEMAKQEPDKAAQLE